MQKIQCVGCYIENETKEHNFIIPMKKSFYEKRDE